MKTITPIHQQFLDAVKKEYSLHAPEHGLNEFREVGICEKDFDVYLENQSLLKPLGRNNESAPRPKPQSLWNNLWYEGELACLFGDAGVGKSLLANQIALDIAAQGRKVLYVDFQNSDAQFNNRYHKENSSIPTSINVTYVGLSAEMNTRDVCNYEAILNSISSEFINYQTPVVIIDDLSYLLPGVFSGKTAKVLQRLRFMVQQWHVSILVVAHTNFHRPDRPLMLRNLSGGSEFAFTFDSIFAMGKIFNNNEKATCSNDQDDTYKIPSHYLKQIKSRNAPLYYTEDNCLRLRLTKDPFRNSYTYFSLFDAYGIECQMLSDDTTLFSDNEKMSLINELHNQGHSLREISLKVQLRPTTIKYLLDKSTSVYKTTVAQSVQSVQCVQSEQENLQENVVLHNENFMSSESWQLLDSRFHLSELINKKGLIGYLDKYFSFNSPFQELLRDDASNILTHNRFSFVGYDALQKWFDADLPPYLLSCLPSVSLKVFNSDDWKTNPYCRCGNLVYDKEKHSIYQIGITNDLFLLTDSKQNLKFDDECSLESALYKAHSLLGEKFQGDSFSFDEDLLKSISNQLNLPINVLREVFYIR